MNIAGIICEYNPFHAGHALHISATRELLGSDTAVFCIMSGNFVQRGEPAVIQKHVRAEAAVRGGADLVAELPLPWAIASAERFSEGGVGVLNACGLPMYLSFGSECGEISRLKKVCDILASENAKALTSSYLSRGLSFAASRQAALDVLSPELSAVLRSPNNLLGIEYLKAIKKLSADITPITVPRIGARHDGRPESGTASASHIRALLSRNEAADGFVPDYAQVLYENEYAAGRAPVGIGSCEQSILYRLRTMSDREYAELPDATEGLGARLSKFGRTAVSLSDVTTSTKSKRYALSRIRRMILAAYLGVTAGMALQPVPYIRVLAMNGRGQELLRAMKKTASVPIITKPASAKKLDGAPRRIFELEARVTDVYSLMFPNPEHRIGGQEWLHSPIRL